MDKKQLGQVIILVVLLGALIVSALVMVRNMNPPKKKPAGGPAPVVGQATEDAKDAAGKASDRTEGGTQNVTEEDREFRDAYLNPNVFKTHALSSPRNPFIQNPEWYSDILSEEMPGYGELNDSDYFEQTVPTIPDIGFIFDGEREWSNISVQRRQENAYTISGESEDGRIQTQIALEEDIPSQQSYTWKADSGVPLDSMRDPEFVKTLLARNPEPSGGMGGQDGMDIWGELFGGLPVPDGLDIPGMTTPEEQPGVLVCKGVSVEGDRASALLMINGMIRLVTKGQVLPPKYKVENITADGVILLDIQDESTEFVPLQGGEPEPFPTGSNT